MYWPYYVCPHYRFIRKSRDRAIALGNSKLPHFLMNYVYYGCYYFYIKYVVPINYCIVEILINTAYNNNYNNNLLPTSDKRSTKLHREEYTYKHTNRQKIQISKVRIKEDIQVI